MYLMQILDKAKKELILRASQRGIVKLRDFMILKNEISTEFKYRFIAKLRIDPSL